MHAMCSKHLTCLSLHFCISSADDGHWKNWKRSHGRWKRSWKKSKGTDTSKKSLSEFESSSSGEDHHLKGSAKKEFDSSSSLEQESVESERSHPKEDKKVKVVHKSPPKADSPPSERSPKKPKKPKPERKQSRKNLRAKPNKKQRKSEEEEE